MIIREKLRKFIADKRRFTIQVEAYIYHDIICPDASDDDVFRFICKSNYSALTVLEPTLGNPNAVTGIEEVVVPYERIYGAYILDVDPALIEKMKEVV